MAPLDNLASAVLQALKAKKVILVQLDLRETLDRLDRQVSLVPREIPVTVAFQASLDLVDPKEPPETRVTEAT